MTTEGSTTGNRRLAKKRVQCLIEALYFVSSSVLADSFVLRNPPERKARNRQAVKKLNFLLSMALYMAS